MAKVLIVEDNPMNRDMLSRRLARQGFQVVIACDGPSSIAMSVSERPDVILMDIALGDMDGWEATQIIKSEPATAQIPVIALTAHALSSHKAKSLAIGCADFDTKPVDMPRLLGKIQRCIATEPLQAS